MQILQRIIGGLVLTFIASGTLSGSVYQAETASLYKAVVEIKNSGYIGDSYINFDNESGSYLELTVGMLNSRKPGS